MKLQDDKKLDNPAWHSLSEAHREIAVDFDYVKFYHPDYSLFGGYNKAEN